MKIKGRVEIKDERKGEERMRIERGPVHHLSRRLVDEVVLPLLN